MELVKRKEGFYVPREYDYDSDTGKESIYREDDCASPPNISFNEEVDKWKLSFASPDFGGYDVILLQYYFDTLKELLTYIGTPFTRIER